MAESLLASHWGTSVAVREAEKIWDRSHIVRLRLADDDRTVVLKRPRADNFGDRTRGFDAELAALEFLSPMETAVAPRLLGADAAAGILIMEDLGPGSSLADSLLRRDRGRAEADLTSYARALAAMHAWSVGRSGEYAELRRASRARPTWRSRRTGWTPSPESKGRFLAMAAQLGLATEGADGKSTRSGLSWLAPAMSASCTATSAPTTRISPAAAAGSSTLRRPAGDP